MLATILITGLFMKVQQIKPYIDDFGNVIHSSDSRVRVMPKHKHKGLLQFTQVHTELGEVVFKLNSLAAFKVLVALITLNAKVNADSNIVIATQAHLAAYAGITQSEVSRGLKSLKEHSIIIDYSRGKVEINPRYVWKGNLNDREEVLENLNRSAAE